MFTWKRIGPVPPWYGWTSLLCPLLALTLGYASALVFGLYAGAVVGSTYLALGINYALQALTDPEQRRVVIIGWAIYVLFAGLLFLPISNIRAS
jgi:hypothetical protein